MKQVVAIHGGNSFATYEEYFADLKNKRLDDPRLGNKGWRSLLGENLGTEYEVITPRMPNGDNARYVEWKIWFEKYIPFMHDRVMLVGHSLGAVFLVKYLAENTFPKVIAGTFLVAGPYSVDEDRQLVEFFPTASLALLAEQGGKLFLYHSKEDDVVPFAELAKYQAALPTAVARSLDGRGHFVSDEFPELVADIKSL